MALMQSVSGIRGTIGGVPGKNLTPPDIVAYTSAYGTWLSGRFDKPVVVIGRDGRISGPHVQSLVTETLRAIGVHVIDVGQSTTPTVEMYVVKSAAQGGIIITASHNPREWNALKFLNAHGEFINEAENQEIKDLYEQSYFTYRDIDNFGTYSKATDAIAYHIEAICALELVDVEAIRKRDLFVAVDCINSTGALAIPRLLNALDCRYVLLHDAITGEFAHNPEPLEENLAALRDLVKRSGADIGLAVDPDVDRLALVDENGKYFGEEYSLVMAADYVLQHTPGPVVTNMSSSQALKDIALRHGVPWSDAPVGELHVVSEMKRVSAVIGGEGNGGIIYPPLHNGRDALVGIALILSHLARSGSTVSDLRAQYPDYHMHKMRMELPGDTAVGTILGKIPSSYPTGEIDRRDGIKITFDKEWIHVRASNTEPILRIYAESTSAKAAQALCEGMRKNIMEGLP